MSVGINNTTSFLEESSIGEKVNGSAEVLGLQTQPKHL